MEGLRLSRLHSPTSLEPAFPHNWYQRSSVSLSTIDKALKSQLASILASLDAAEQDNITLLYSAHDTKHDNAISLKSYLERLSLPPDR